MEKRDSFGFDESDKLTLGTLLNQEQYKIASHLGGGGFSITYSGFNIAYIKNNRWNDRVILKEPELIVIKELFTKDCDRHESGEVKPRKQFAQDFDRLLKNHFREGERIRKLIHPHIVQVKDIFEQNGTAYLILEFLPGTDLYGLMSKRGKLPKIEAFMLIKQVLSALDFIHAQDSMHLDISPGNIMISENGKKATLIDFGISHVYDKEKKIILTTSNEYAAGIKPKYAAPERWSRESIRDFRPQYDTYSTVATLYFILSGEEVPDYDEIRDRPESLSLKNKIKDEEWSEFLDEIIRKGLDPLFWGRYKTVSDLLDALDDELAFNHHKNQLHALIDAGNSSKSLNYIEMHMGPYMKLPDLIELKAQFTAKMKPVVEEKRHFQIGTMQFSQNDLLNARESLRLANRLDARNRPAVRVMLQACEERIKTEYAAIHQKHFEDSKLFESANNLEAALREYQSAKKLFETSELLIWGAKIESRITQRKRQQELIARIEENIKKKDLEIAKFHLSQLQSEFPGFQALNLSLKIKEKEADNRKIIEFKPATFTRPSSGGNNPNPRFVIGSDGFLKPIIQVDKGAQGWLSLDNLSKDHFPTQTNKIKDLPFLTPDATPNTAKNNGKSSETLNKIFGKRRLGREPKSEPKKTETKGAVPIVKDGVILNKATNNTTAYTQQDASRPLYTKGKKINYKLFAWPLWGFINYFLQRIWPKKYTFWLITISLILFFGYNLFIDNSPLRKFDHFISGLFK